MNRRLVSSTLLVSLAGVLLTGCMPKMTIEDMKNLKPQRPPELDKLNAFVGRWSGTSQMEMAGIDEVITGSATSEVKWDGDGWFLVDKYQASMGDAGEMNAIGVWTYDPQSKKYRTFWADNTGGTGAGTIRHDEKTGTWKFNAKSRGGPMGRTVGKGPMKFVDDKTMEWT